MGALLQILYFFVVSELMVNQHVVGQQPLALKAKRSIQKAPLLHNSQYDCIFGFSTGHVGTTSLGAPDAYGEISNAEFLFEGSFAGNGTKVTKEMHKANFSRADEFAFVETEFAPFLKAVQEHRQATLLVDLGHWSLYYYRGIHDFFKSPAGLKTGLCHNILWVRLTRDRYETAVSLMYIKERIGYANVCEEISVVFCPYHNVPQVILRPPSRHIWGTMFRTFQKALWIVDETEARWKAFKAQEPGLNFLELEWAVGESGSFERVRGALAAAIGVPTPDFKLAKTKIHAGDRNRPSVHNMEKERMQKWDAEYKRLMQYNCTHSGPQLVC